MFVTQPLNELAKLALVASDASYFTPTQTLPLGGALAPLRDTPTYDILPPYAIVPCFVKDSSDAQSQDDSNGFKFAAYRKPSSNEVIIAFGTHANDFINGYGPFGQTFNAFGAKGLLNDLNLPDVDSAVTN